MSLILSGTDGLSDVDGTAATPAIRGTDANTGIFFGTDIIGFSEGGVEAARIDASGNFGLGVTPSANAGQRTLNVANFTGTFNALTMGANGTNAGYIGYNMGNTSTSNTWRYQGADTGSALYFAGNELRFMIFPLGIAAATTSGTQAMTLDASGNFVVGSSTALKFNTTGSAAARLLTLFSTGTNSGLRSEFQIGNASTASGDITGLIMFGCGASNTTANAPASIYSELTASSTSVAYGALVFATANGAAAAERVRINSSGNVRINYTGNIDASNPERFGITYTYPQTGMAMANGSTLQTYAILFTNPNGIVGSIQTSASATLYVTTSDYRLKENIAPMTSALVTVAKLKPCTYTWKADGSDGQGFIAHELAEVVPECVSGEKDAVNEDGTINPQGVDYGRLTPILTAALKEAIAKIETLEARIAALEAK